MSSITSQREVVVAQHIERELRFDAWLSSIGLIALAVCVYRGYPWQILFLPLVYFLLSVYISERENHSWHSRYNSPNSDRDYW